MYGIHTSARVIFKKYKSDPAIPQLKTHQWLPITLRITSKFQTVTWPVLHNLALGALSDCTSCCACSYTLQSHSPPCGPSVHQALFYFRVFPVLVTWLVFLSFWNQVKCHLFNELIPYHLKKPPHSLLFSELTSHFLHTTYHSWSYCWFVHDLPSSLDLKHHEGKDQTWFWSLRYSLSLGVCLILSWHSVNIWWIEEYKK